MCVTLHAQQDKNAQKAEKARIANVKKEIDAAKTNIKQGKNLPQTETSMRNLLKDSLNANDLRIYSLLKESILLQYAQINEKAFLKQKYDTAQMFQISSRLFEALENMDRIDALPDSKGRVNPKYRDESATLLSQFMGNLYSGLVFYVNKQKWNEALAIGDLYLTAPTWNFKLSVDEKRRIHSSYLMLFSGFKNKSYPMALKYAEDALKYESRHESTLQYICEMYDSQKDTEAYIGSLTRGLEAYPTSSYFFTRLVDHYINASSLDKAAEVTQKVIDADSLNVPALVARQTILLNLAKYDECIALGEQILANESSLFPTAETTPDATPEELEEAKDDLAEVNYNIALSYYNKSLDVEKTVKNTRQREAALKPLYKQCRPYMERFRKLMPDEKDKWKPVLYTIYLNLNLGKEFAEIEKL